MSCLKRKCEAGSFRKTKIEQLLLDNISFRSLKYIALRNTKKIPQAMNVMWEIHIDDIAYAPSRNLPLQAILNCLEAIIHTLQFTLDLDRMREIADVLFKGVHRLAVPAGQNLLG